MKKLQFSAVHDIQRLATNRLTSVEDMEGEGELAASLEAEAAEAATVAEFEGLEALGLLVAVTSSLVSGLRILMAWLRGLRSYLFIWLLRGGCVLAPGRLAVWPPGCDPACPRGGTPGVMGCWG